MFTQGEWRTESNFVGVEMEGNLYEICKVSNFQPEAKENTRLIAAAPDMYQALKNLINWLEIPGEHGKGFVMTEAKKALIKAELEGEGLVLELGCHYLNSEFECEKGLLINSKCPSECVYYDDGSR